MPMTIRSPGKEERQARSVREIEEIIGAIEQYLQQTREVLDRIGKDIAELKNDSSFKKEKDEVIHPKKEHGMEMRRIR